MRIAHPRFGFRAVVAVVALVAAPIAVTILTIVPSGAVSTFTVINNADSGVGSLRQAFLDANAANDNTVINFNAGLSVSITGSELTFAPVNSASTLTINGNGSTVTRTALTDRIFDDEASGVFTINSLTVTGGHVLSSTASGGSIFSNPDLVINNSSVSGTADASGPAGGTAEGGAVWSDGTVTVTNSTITGTADAHGTAVGVVGGSAEGGGIWANEAITISQSSVTGTADAQNTSAAGGDAQGGAVWSDTTVTTTSSTFSGQALANGNTGGSAEGGGVWANESVSLTDSMVSNSQANASGANGFAEGGAVWTDQVATLVRTTLGDSLAQATGAGAGAEGGGLWALEAAILTNSTVAANAAIGSIPTVGGGIFESDGDVTLVYSDVVGNSADVGANISGPEAVINAGAPRPAQSATLHAFASVVVQPAGGGLNCEGFASTDTTGFNFSDDLSCAFTDSTDDQGLGNDALLGALAANGGIPETLLPGGASPLINAIPNVDCQSGPASGITTDERLLPRPEQSGGLCDIGAVEVQVAPSPTTTTTTTTLPPSPTVTTTPPAPQPAPAPPVAIQPAFTG